MSSTAATRPIPNFPCWAIIDSQAREKYPFASVMPGQDWPEGLGPSPTPSPSWRAKIGVDAQGLEATVASFNANAEKGEDPEFGRGTQPLERLDVRRSVSTSRTLTSAR